MTTQERSMEEMEALPSRRRTLIKKRRHEPNKRDIEEATCAYLKKGGKITKIENSPYKEKKGLYRKAWPNI